MTDERRPEVPVRVAAKALGVSPSSYVRLVKGRAASAAPYSSGDAGDETAQFGLCT